MTLKLPLIFILCFIAIASYGQVSATKSKEELLKEIKKSLPDSNRQKIYNELGKLYLTQLMKTKANIDSAYYFFRKSVYLLDSSNINNNRITNESLCLLAETYLCSGDSEDLIQGKKIFAQVIENYQKARDKINEGDTWYRMSMILIYTDPNVPYIQSCFDHALSLFAEKNNIIKKIDIVCGMADFHFRRGNSALAEKEVLNTIKESKENGSYKLSEMYLFLAVQNRYKGNLTEGLKYALAAEEHLSQDAKSYNAHNVYGELALEYQHLNQPEKSIYWYKKCITKREEKKINQFVIYRTYYLMVVQMIKLGRQKEALATIQHLEIINPPIGSTENAVLSQCLGYCFNKNGQFHLAEKYFLKMIKEYGAEKQNVEVLSIARYDIGKFYVEQNLYKKAEPYLQDAFNAGGAIPLSMVKDIHFFMFKIDSANGKYISAIENFQQYKALNDSIFSEAKSKQVEELMIKYETGNKDKNIIILQKENLIQQEGLKQATYTRNFILAGIVLLCFIVALLYNRYWYKQKTNRHLEAKQKKIEIQNLSLHHLVNEKEWLLKEIHHRVKNNLHTITGLLDTQAGFLKTEEALLAISDSQHRVQSMSLIHQKLFQSEDLSTIEMSGYIHELVDYLKHSFDTGQRIRFKLDIDNLVVSLSHSLPIGLILNEAITNSMKYAFPDNKDGVILISLKQTSTNHYLLTVADNGKGIPAGFDYQKSGSMGISLMLGLSEDIQGSFSMKNNSGTEIQIQFSYDPVNEDNLMPKVFT